MARGKIGFNPALGWLLIVNILPILLKFNVYEKKSLTYMRLKIWAFRHGLYCVLVILCFFSYYL